MPTATLISKNPDGTSTIRKADGSIVTVKTATAQQNAPQGGTGENDNSAVLQMLNKHQEEHEKEIEKQERQKATDYLLDISPTALSQGAALLVGGSKWPVGAAVAAGMGGLSEAGVRELLGQYLYSTPQRREEIARMTAGDVAARMGKEAAIQGGGEIAGRMMGGTFDALLEKLGLGKAAATQAGARAGKMIQLTPGEAKGSVAQTAMEDAIGHLPGGMQAMHAFREKRMEQAIGLFDQELKNISEQGLTKEETGLRVQAAIDKLLQESQQEANAVYNPLKEPLGLPQNASKEDLEAAARKAAGKGNTAPLAALRDADKQYAQIAQKNNLEVMRKLADARPEVTAAYVSKASLADIRTITATLPEADRRALARNVVESALESGRNPATGNYSAEAVLKRMKALDKDGPKTEMLLGSKSASTFRSILQEMTRTQHELPFKNARDARYMLMLMEGTAAAVLGFKGHPMAAGAVIAGSVLGPRILAEVATNPELAVKYLTAMRRFSSTAARLGPTATADWLAGMAEQDNANTTMEQQMLGPSISEIVQSRVREHQNAGAVQ